MVGDGTGGGSLALVGAFDKCGGALYADVLREYGVDLGGLVSDPPSLSPAEALALVENLSPGSYSSAILRGEEDGYGWGTTEVLLAGVIDAIKEGTFSNIQVRTKKKLKPPEPIPVPGRRVKPKVNNFLAAAKAYAKQAERE